MLEKTLPVKHSCSQSWGKRVRDDEGFLEEVGFEYGVKQWQNYGWWKCWIQGQEKTRQHRRRLTGCRGCRCAHRRKVYGCSAAIGKMEYLKYFQYDFSRIDRNCTVVTDRIFSESIFHAQCTALLGSCIPRSPLALSWHVSNYCLLFSQYCTHTRHVQVADPSVCMRSFRPLVGSDPDAVWDSRSGGSRMRHAVGFGDR